MFDAYLSQISSCLSVVITTPTFATRRTADGESADAVLVGKTCRDDTRARRDLSKSRRSFSSKDTTIMKKDSRTLSTST